MQPNGSLLKFNIYMRSDLQWCKFFGLSTMYKAFLSFSFAAFSLALTGCASITSGKIQPVSVTTSCEAEPMSGANCTLTNDKGSWFVKTPGSVSINKSYGDMTIECAKSPHARGVGTFKSANEGAVWGNILAGGIIGYAVDASSGAGFSYPPTMNVNMAGDCKAAKD